MILLFASTIALSSSQQTTGTAMDPETRGRQIVAHLNAVIQFYRASVAPIQKAGEPNDIIYWEQAQSLSAEIAGFAFASSKAEAQRLAQQAGTAAAGPGSEQQKMQALEANVDKQIDDLHARQTGLENQIEKARPKDLAALQAEKTQLQGSLELSNAMKDALQRIVDMPGGANSTGLTGDIDRLQSSVPELQGKTKTALPQMTNIDAARSAGVTSQGMVLLYLMETQHSLQGLIKDNDALHKQVVALRTPISAALRTLIVQGQQLSQQAASSSPTAPAAAGTPPASGPQATDAPTFKSITAQFKSISAASVPLSQEVIALEQSRANIRAWQSSVNREYTAILHALLLRILVIVIALAVILGAGEVWTRITNQYVKDIRRRRQFLLVRRTVVSFLCAIVLVFGFVTQFNSLATFAGFITAGIAVGLQTILLSVAAYFFIIGRYGVKVGDRITIASVTGDVIDVGLVRFYMMELAGSGTELNPTGRVAVFSNAVLFQAGTPLYKQIPGTEYAWHELVVKLKDDANYPLISEAVMKEVHAVFDGYKSQIERQHRGVEAQMQTTIGPPVVESRLQSSGGALQLWARYPVQLREAAEIDEKLMRALTGLLARTPEVKDGIAATPTIQASVRG